MTRKNYVNPKSRIPALGGLGASKHRIMLASRNIPAQIPAETVRVHLEALVEIGVGPTMIARAAGVSRGVPERILKGEWGKVGIRHASALMKVTHVPHPAQARVLSIGSARRIAALRAIGWPLDALSSRLGYQDPWEAQRIQTRSWVTYAVWRRVFDLYEDLSATTGNSERAASHALRQGWLLPMEWEGYDIDDPRVTPPRTNRTVGAAMRSQLDERRTQVAEMVKRGMSTHEIAQRLGVTPRTVARHRSALERKNAA